MIPQKKILIIEEDSFLNNALEKKLTDEGFSVTIAKDGKEGFEKIKNEKPHLILLDILMPRMSGYEILEAKQKDPSIEPIPVVIVSNTGEPVEINRALALGVKDYIIKTEFDPEEVIAKVRTQISGSEIASFDADSVADESKPLLGKKILWVEDDKFLSDIIAKKLAGAGCTLIHASDGEEALARIEKDPPDVVLLDIMLSGMDGFEILRRIKASDQTKNIPVIMLSNLGQKSDIDKGSGLGAARFLVKATVNLDEIVREIDAVIRESSKKTLPPT